MAANKVNEFRLGYVYTLESQDVTGPRLFDQFGIKGALDAPDIKGLPTFNLTGFSQLGTPTTLGSTPIPASGSGNRPVLKSGKVWQLLDNFSWTHDRHAIKFGVDISRVTEFAKATNSARPGFTFNGTYTGSGLADFLLGYIFSANTSQQQLLTIQQYVYDGYAQDDWKVSRKLTINLGLRYELPTPFFEARDRQSNFVLDAGPCYLQLVTVAQRGQCNADLGRYMTRLDKNNFAPRVGLAYQATDKIVIRSGFGIFYGRDENYGISARLPSNPPWVSTSTFTGTATAPVFLLKDGFPPNALALTATGFNANTTVYSQPFNFPTSYVEQWNVNVQRQFGGDFVGQIGYTGSGAHKMLFPVNMNQAVPGTGAVNSRRPYQGVGNITYYAPLINSTYHALVAKVERRFAKGLSLLASYTMGHSIDGEGNEHDTSDATHKTSGIWRPRKARRTSTCAIVSPSAASTNCLLAKGRVPPHTSSATGKSPESSRHRPVSRSLPRSVPILPEPVPPRGQTGLQMGICPPTSERAPIGSTRWPSLCPTASVLATRVGAYCAARALWIWTCPSCATSTSPNAFASNSAPSRSI